jgi:hypothetical protein
MFIAAFATVTVTDPWVFISSCIEKNFHHAMIFLFF